MFDLLSAIRIVRFLYVRLKVYTALGSISFALCVIFSFKDRDRLVQVLL